MSIYQAFKRSLAAGETFETSMFGRYLTILTWRDPIDVEISIEREAFAPIKAGMSVKLSEQIQSFTSVRFKNTSSNSVVLEYACSNGEIFDNRFNPRLPTKPIGFNLIPCSSAPGGTLVVPLNLDRTSLLIRNLATNTGKMYVGYDNTLTATKYVVGLLPGQSISIGDYLGAVYCQSTVNLEGVSYGEV